MPSYQMRSNGCSATWLLFDLASPRSLRSRLDRGRLICFCQTAENCKALPAYIASRVEHSLNRFSDSEQLAVALRERQFRQRLRWVVYRLIFG